MGAAERQMQTDDMPNQRHRQTEATTSSVSQPQANEVTTWNSDVVASGEPGSSTPNRDSNSTESQVVTDENVIQEAIAEVSTSSTVENNEADFTFTLRKLPRVPKVVETNFNRDVLLGRWSHSLELFGRVFIDDVGA